MNATAKKISDFFGAAMRACTPRARPAPTENSESFSESRSSDYILTITCGLNESNNATMSFATKLTGKLKLRSWMSTQMLQPEGISVL